MKWIIAIVLVSIVGTGIIQGITCSRDYVKGAFYE